MRCWIRYIEEGGVIPSKIFLIIDEKVPVQGTDSLVGSMSLFINVSLMLDEIA